MRITGQTANKIANFLQKYNREIQVEFRDLETGENIQVNCVMQNFSINLGAHIGNYIDLDFIEVQNLYDHKHIGNLAFDPSKPHVPISTGCLENFTITTQGHKAEPEDPSEACPGCGYSKAICKC